MPVPTSRLAKNRRDDPKYRHYKPKGLAVVRVDGRDVYLGKYDSPESWEKYYRVLADRRASGRAGPATEPTEGGARPALSVNELLLHYWRHAEGYYRREDGAPTAELDTTSAWPSAR